MKTWIVLPLVVVAFGCGNTNDEPYKAQPAWTGRKPSLPSPPTVSVTLKSGEAYTVAGAIHQLRSRLHEKDVSGKEITIAGVIVESNITNAPACAIHKTGTKDSDDCKAEIPSFWIADTKDSKQRIRVLGWAKNFASVFDAMQKYKNLKEPPKELVKDDMMGVDLPFPLPAVGAKVKITGKYGYTFTKASTGIVSDPESGVLTYTKMDVVEAAPEPAKFANKK